MKSDADVGIFSISKPGTIASGDIPFPAVSVPLSSSGGQPPSLSARLMHNDPGEKYFFLFI